MNDPEANIGNSYFGQKHPMKPFRIILAHELIMKYGLYKKMKIYHPFKATSEDMMKFHSEQYIQFLESVNVANAKEVKDLIEKFVVGIKDDCPIFEGLFSFSQISTGGSLSAASSLISGSSDIAINWAGGLHHAKKSEASGFCYINDIVLCILELLKFYNRVLYVDLDVHHGDGVEEAFYTTNRVMTVSFHQYEKEFFPGTGGFNDIGADSGKYYSINVPLKAGLTNDDYEKVFVPIMSKVMEVYNPSVIVLQCGADSLAGDLLGDFNLTLKGHANCVKFMKKFHIPMILLGGGGYTLKNVSRCWCYETGVALNIELPRKLPINDFTNYFHPTSVINIRPERKLNLNTQKSLNECIQNAFENLRNVQCVPSVQIMDVPANLVSQTSIIDLCSDDDLRRTSDLSVQILSENDFYDDFDRI